MLDTQLKCQYKVVLMDKLENWKEKSFWFWITKLKEKNETQTLKIEKFITVQSIIDG